jgi:hypothetical protein
MEEHTIMSDQEEVKIEQNEAVEDTAALPEDKGTQSVEIRVTGFTLFAKTL